MHMFMCFTVYGTKLKLRCQFSGKSVVLLSLAAKTIELTVSISRYYASKMA